MFNKCLKNKRKSFDAKVYIFLGFEQQCGHLQEKNYGISKNNYDIINLAKNRFKHK